MRYHALACDYDGTLASHGRVADPTVEALERVRGSGRRLLLVTGRQLPDLAAIFTRLDLFEAVVAENGAVLYRPASREHKVLCDPPPVEFVRRLEAAGVPLAVGHAIVATGTPHDGAVLEAIRELGLELHVIFNKGAVMVLPSGVNKGSGVAAALRELGLSRHNVVCVGDAENDHALLAACECGVAVANSVTMLKERADQVTTNANGAGVRELADELVADDLRALAPRLVRHDLLVGWAEGDAEVRVPAYGSTVLLAGPSGSGKSTFATAFLEELAENGWQFCILDPEGDYRELPGAIVLGDSHHVPAEDEVLTALGRPDQNVVVNLLGVGIEDRPRFFAALFPRLQEMRTRVGRPHWVLLDETHHLLPAAADSAGGFMPRELQGLMFITVHPDHVSPEALSVVDFLVTIGADAEETLGNFARALGQDPPAAPKAGLPSGEAIGWWRREGAAPFWFRSQPPRTERRRHVRKYAEGELPPDRSFYFHGPEGKLNLRAQNLRTFLQLADGVDDETWLHHLKQRDYSTWFRSAIKDEVLAEAAERIEREPGVSARDSRQRIRGLIEELYTAPA
jgi:hydroxymethylpyrimidine pyrophosphatase-like HAD family hydrolase